MAAQDQGLGRGLSVYEREKEESSQSTQLSLAPLAEQMVLWALVQQPEAPEPLLVEPC